MKIEKIKALKKAAYPAAMLVLIIGVAFGCLAINNSKQKSINDEKYISEIIRLENKITNLEQILLKHLKQPAPITSADIAALNDKFDTLNKLNDEILDSKANLSSVMSIVERIDSLESEIKRLNSGTSNSALVLTAAALVESAAKKRQPFMYEASVLENLSRNTPMEKSAQIIAGLSIKGIPSKEELIERFIKLYEANFIEKEQPHVNPVTQPRPKNWKENLKAKFETMFVIEKIGEGGEVELARQETPVDDIYRLVRDGDFETATLKMTTDKKYQTEPFEIWIEDTRSEKIFNKQMAKIKALTLGEMKSEIIK